MDGTVKGGKSTVDESSLTGEPLPVLKQQGVGRQDPYPRLDKKLQSWILHV